MWQQVLNMAVNNGIWAVLFCALLIYQLKDSRVREDKYQQTIEDLNKSLTIVNNVSKDINKIDKDVEKISDNVISISKKVSSINLNVVQISKSLEGTNALMEKDNSN